MSSYISGVRAYSGLAADSLVQLRAAESIHFKEGQEAYVRGGKVYRWDPAGFGSDDGDLIVLPDDVSDDNNGRWLKYTILDLQALMAYQAPVASPTAIAYAIIATAFVSSAIIISRVDLLLNSDLIADDTDYRTIEIHDLDGNGGDSLIASMTTETLGSLGLGNLLADVSNTIWTNAPSGPYTLFPGHWLRVKWVASGSGVSVPEGCWRVR